MFKKQLMLILSLVMVASLLLAACQPAVETKIVEVTVPVKEVATQVVEVTKEVEKEVEVVVEVTPTPEPVTRRGSWLDQVVFTSIDDANQAVAQIQSGDLDIYAYGVADAGLFETVKSDPKLAYVNSFGSYTELTFNPGGGEDAIWENAQKLNPFVVPAIREAMNWLIDRDYIVQEIYSGLAKPKYTSLNSAFPDYVRFVDVLRKLETYYAYNPDKANEVVTAEMEKLGATKVDGKWQYNGEPVTLIGIIRVEDERKEIGDYVANQLETVLGFTVDRQYKTRTEASPIWLRSNPEDGLWHWYTGGWITTAVSRDDGTNFGYFYTPLGSGSPLWQAYVNDPAYFEVAERLWNNEFTSMEERAELFKTALELANKESQRVWIADQLSFSPYNANVSVAADLAGGISGAILWPFTARFKDQEGGTLRIAQPGILVDPWNPIAGSNWIYDTMPFRATMDFGTLADPYTGLAWPQRIERAEITVKEGLPVAKTLDWVSLEFVPEIQVPADAWADWDAVNQKFITVGEKYTSTVTANTKRVVYYPADLFETVKWHDGSPLSMGDFVMGMILTFDRAKPESAIYDESAVPAFESFMSVFKGVKVVSTNPLVIETYSDAYGLDAELMVSDWWPNYAQGTGSWSNLALGIRAEAAKLLTFSADKADALKEENEKIEWMSFIAGPSLAILKSELVSATAEAYLPYAPTMGQYVSAEEVAERYENLASWYRVHGHFWVGVGPFYLNQAFPIEKSLSLLRNDQYVDFANKWERFGAPLVAEVEVDGPGQVAAGDAATFDVFITFQGEPYPADQVDAIKYLLYNATGELVVVGDGTIADGTYKVELTSDVTSKLVSGSNKLEVAVTSKAVSIPSFDSFEFVTP